MEDKIRYDGFATPSFTLEGSDLFDHGDIYDCYLSSKLKVGTWHKGFEDGLIHINLYKPIQELNKEREEWAWQKTIMSDKDIDNYKRSLPEASPEGKTSSNHHVPKKQMILDKETGQFKMV